MTEYTPANFLEEFVLEDIRNGNVKGVVTTRFPPEPNGWLHIGHVKALYIDFATAEHFGGKCNLRFDDTNPAKEEISFVEAIKNDIRWMGFQWDKLVFGSEYFDVFYEKAELLIRKGLAYVDDLTREEMKEYRGTLTKPGKNSPYRDRPIEENLRLFREMRDGKYQDGEKTLRAKIDMTSPNMNMRDPAIYRIKHMAHHQTGDRWCIYPMYDFAHPLEDAVEGVTHSFCSYEYENHRPLYDWFRDHCDFESHPRQIEFARLNITHTVLSKRFLRALVENGLVSGWDDPRMPTLAGLRRRGYTPAAICDFLRRAGVAKADSVVDIRLLEHCVREDLNESAPRAMAVLRPVKVTLTNWPEGRIEPIECANHPMHPELGSRTIPFTGSLYIESDDFMETPPPKFFRLAPGREVRLKDAYIIRCESVVKDENGCVSEILCTVDLDSKSGSEGANRKVKGTLHWVDASDAHKAVCRLYEYMLRDEENDDESDDAEDEEETVDKTTALLSRFNHDSIVTLEDCLVEGALAAAKPGDHFQFLRQGYFVSDPDSRDGAPVFNRVVELKDSYKP